MVKGWDSNISNADKDFILRTCNNPYDIKLLLKYGVADFKDYVNAKADKHLKEMETKRENKFR